MNPTTDVWLTPPNLLRLGADEVHVWRARLVQSEAQLSNAFALLSNDERERADRFHFRKDRDHYVAARAALRDILGRYLDAPPDETKFCYNKYGKPALRDAREGSGLSFNVSHSSEIALYAVAQSKSIGIDVERVREFEDFESIAERFFSAEEVSVIKNLPGESRAAAFFNYWTHKEAYVKAYGEGLSRPLDGFTVSFVEGERAMITSADDDHGENSKWSLFGLSPGSGYVAALAVEGHVSRLDCWQWQFR